jgi:hypothetical protein
VRLRRSEGETGKCAYVDLKEKRVSALTSIFLTRVKTLYLRSDALHRLRRSELRLELRKNAETKIERLYIRFSIS